MVRLGLVGVVFFGGGLYGVSERGGDIWVQGSQPGGKSCSAVWRSGLWCSGTIFLMVGAGKRLWEGWVGSFTILVVLLEHRARKGEGHQWSLQLWSLSTGGSCGQWGVVTRVSPEVHHNLLCLTHIKGQVVCTTPFSQLCHFLSSAFHSCCWWDLPLMYHRQTWWCGWSWTWQCRCGSAA